MTATPRRRRRPRTAAIVAGPLAIERRALAAGDHRLLDLVLDALGGWPASIAALAAEASRQGGNA